MGLRYGNICRRKKFKCAYINGKGVLLGEVVGAPKGLVEVGAVLLSFVLHINFIFFLFHDLKPDPTAFQIITVRVIRP